MTAKTIKVGDFEIFPRDVNNLGEFELSSIFDAPIFGYRKVDPETAKIVMHMFNFADESPSREMYDVDTYRNMIAAKLDTWTGGTPPDRFNPLMQGYQQHGPVYGSLVGSVFRANCCSSVSTIDSGEFIITIVLPTGTIEIGNESSSVLKQSKRPFMQPRDSDDGVGVLKFQLIIDGAKHEGRLRYAVPVSIPKANRKAIELQLAETITTMNGDFGSDFKLPVTDVKLV